MGGTFSFWHWLVVLVIVALVFGTKKLRNIGGDLGSGQPAAASNRDDIPLELRRELLRHRDILPAEPRPAKAMSTKLAADPITV